MLRQIAKHAVPSRVRRVLRQAAERLAVLRRRFYCPVCNCRVARFENLPRYYYDQWERHGFDCDTRKWETCNTGAYTCPRCGATDRDRLYAIYLGSRLCGRGSEFRLLDIAPSAPLSNYIRKTFPIHYRTCDLLMEGVDDKIDITTMDRYPAAHFDALICSHVLEHVPDDRAAIAELYRILKRGGWGIIMVPIELELEEIREEPAVTSEADRWRLFGQYDHVRIYSRTGFVNRLENGGFEVHLLSATALGGSKLLQRCGIGDKSVLYVSEKQIACDDGVCRRNKSIAPSPEGGNPSQISAA